jgi:hypothetical protein
MSPVHDSCPSSLARKLAVVWQGKVLINSDLLLIKSKLYNLEHGVLTMDRSREFGGTPVVKLGDNFKKVAVGYSLIQVHNDHLRPFLEL